MTEHSAPDVECEQKHAALRVSDVAAAVDFYTSKLGFRLGSTWGDPPSMAGVHRTASTTTATPAIASSSDAPALSCCSSSQ